jgi:hypothetical protein
MCVAVSRGFLPGSATNQRKLLQFTTIHDPAMPNHSLALGRQSDRLFLIVLVLSLHNYHPAWGQKINHRPHKGNQSRTITTLEWTIPSPSPQSIGNDHINHEFPLPTFSSLTKLRAELWTLETFNQGDQSEIFRRLRSGDWNTLSATMRKHSSGQPVEIDVSIWEQWIKKGSARRRLSDPFLWTPAQ